MTTEFEILDESMEGPQETPVSREWAQTKQRLAHKIRTAQDTNVFVRSQSELRIQCEEEDQGPERNSHSLLQGIKSGTIDAKDLTIDERRVVIQTLKELGRSQDEIAALLNISRRTVVTDYKWLKEAAATEVKGVDRFALAGEVYTMGMACARKALSEGMYKSVSYIMRDTVEILQSLGVAYRAPAQLRALQLSGTVKTQQSYLDYKQTISGQEEKVIEVLSKMMCRVEEY